MSSRAAQSRRANPVRRSMHRTFVMKAIKLIEAVEEALNVGERADVMVQLSHHKAAWRRNWGKVHRSLEIVDRVRYGRTQPSRATSIRTSRCGPISIRSCPMTFATADRRRRSNVCAIRRPQSAVLLALEMRFTAQEWNDILITDVRTPRNEELAGKRIDEIAYIARRQTRPRRARSCCSRNVWRRKLRSLLWMKTMWQPSSQHRFAPSQATRRRGDSPASRGTAFRIRAHSAVSHASSADSCARETFSRTKKPCAA